MPIDLKDDWRGIFECSRTVDEDISEEIQEDPTFFLREVRKRLAYCAPAGMRVRFRLVRSHTDEISTITETVTCGAYRLRIADLTR